MSGPLDKLVVRVCPECGETRNSMEFAYCAGYPSIGVAHHPPTGTQLYVYRLVGKFDDLLAAERAERNAEEST